MHKSPDDDMDPVWDEMADAEEDLDQYSYYMDTLKERFLNLIELVSRHCLAFERRVLTWFTGIQYRECQSVRLLAILVNHCSSIPPNHISHCESHKSSFPVHVASFLTSTERLWNKHLKSSSNSVSVHLDPVVDRQSILYHLLPMGHPTLSEVVVSS
jgi:hypothetical protein